MDSDAGNKSFIQTPGAKHQSKNFDQMNNSERKQELKDRIQQYLKNKKQPVYRNLKEKEVYEMIENDEQKEIFEKLREKLKVFKPLGRKAVRAEMLPFLK